MMEQESGLDELLQTWIDAAQAYALGIGLGMPADEELCLATQVHATFSCLESARVAQRGSPKATTTAQKVSNEAA
jgi:hypothetical protein